MKLSTYTTPLDARLHRSTAILAQELQVDAWERKDSMWPAACMHCHALTFGFDIDNGADVRLVPLDHHHGAAGGSVEEDHVT